MIDFLIVMLPVLTGLVILCAMQDQRAQAPQDAPTATQTLPDVHPRVIAPIKPTQARRLSWVEQAQADHLLRLHKDDPNGIDREVA